MNSAVVVPPFRHFYATPRRQSALGARVVEGILTQHGVEVTFHDFAGRSRAGCILTLPDHLSHLRDFIVPHETGPVSFFTRYHRFGPSIEDCAVEICDSRPDVIFVACFAFCYAASAIELAEECRTRLPRCSIVMGGAGASVHPGYFLRSPAIDYVLTGEAETVLPPFLRFLRSSNETPGQVPNVWYREDRGIRASGVQQFGDSAIHVPISLWSPNSRRLIVRTAVSRGCPRTCRYCANHLVHGRALRTAGFESVDISLGRTGLETFDKQKHITVVLEDDNLLAAPDYTLELLALLRRRFREPDILFENGIDYLHLTPELVQRLVLAGVARFSLSLCSVDSETVRSQNRPHDADRYGAIVAALQHLGIPSVTYFICGLASDTRETIAASLAYLYSTPTLSGISLFYPVPGLADYADLTVFDEVHPSLCAGSSAWPWSGSLSTQTMVTAFRLSRYVNLCKKRYRSGVENTIVNKVQSERRLYTIVRCGERREIALVPEQDQELVRIFFRNASARVSRSGRH